MQRGIGLFVSIIWSCAVMAQGLIGAWEGYHTSEGGLNFKSVVIFTDGYQAISVYEAETGRLVSTNGGAWRLEDSTIMELVEFDSNTPNRIGSSV